MVVESGDSDHFVSNPLTLTELRLQISFEATVQTLTEVRLFLLITIKVTYIEIENCIFFEYPTWRGCEIRRKCPLDFYLLWVLSCVHNMTCAHPEMCSRFIFRIDCTTRFRKGSNIVFCNVF